MNRQWLFAFTLGLGVGVSFLAYAQNDASKGAADNKKPTDAKTEKPKEAPIPKGYESLQTRASYGFGANIGKQIQQQEKDMKADLIIKGIKDAIADKTKEKASYGIGLQIGRNLVDSDLQLNTDTFLKGMQDSFAKKELVLTDTQIRKSINEYHIEVRKKATEKRAAEQKKTGTEFLAKNGKRKEVTTTKSGLQYEVIKAGTGAMPKETDTVKVHYRGTLVDGTEFDSSYKFNQPATFGVNQVIEGWIEGLKLMKVGAKWKFFIPSKLAYKERGQGRIPPNAVLIFEVELLSIEKPKQPGAPGK